MELIINKLQKSIMVCISQDKNTREELLQTVALTSRLSLHSTVTMSGNNVQISVLIGRFATRFLVAFPA